MIVNRVRNVCQALPKTMELLLEQKPQSSRAGQVLVAPEPVVTVYERPRERVLFSAVRDANPWFHVVEALWMLAGRDDAATLNRFVKNFGERFAEPDDRIHDAYGRRWRTVFGFDQLQAAVDRLTVNPEDRQCVITMWDPQRDGNDDMNPRWRGRPCNTHLYLRMVGYRLDMTICCRSNDMIMGGHGANAVHFSILLEYLAARLNANVGVMYQLSNNCHVYVDDVQRLQSRVEKYRGTLIEQLTDDRYSSGARMYPSPMFNKPSYIDEDVLAFFTALDTGDYRSVHFNNSWFKETLLPMMWSHYAYSQGNKRAAHEIASTILAPDWRTACEEWLERRI
jgi:thymidylate synthase